MLFEDNGASLAMRDIRRPQRELEDALNPRRAAGGNRTSWMNQLQQAMNDYSNTQPGNSSNRR